MATLSGRDYPAQCPMVLSLCAVLPRLGRDDAGARYRGRSFDHQSLGIEIRLGIGQTHPASSTTNDSWRVDETYVKVKGQWKYLYRAVDSEGNTLDFLLSAKRDGKAAERFFRKVLKATHTQTPRVITVDKNAAYPKAIENLQGDETLSGTTEL